MCLIGMAVAACTSIDCPVQNTVYTIYDIMQPNGNKDTLTADTLTISTKRLDKEQRDTIVLNKLCGAKAFTFNLPISHVQPEDVFVLDVRNTAGLKWIDTLRIKKENIPHFESVDCQVSYFHTITAVSVTHHIVDSVVINNPHVNYDTKTTHFKLYLKARQ